MNGNFEKSLRTLNDCSCKSVFSGTKVLIFLKVHQGSHRLEISATDIKGNYWELLVTYQDFQKHIENLGLLNSDWENFFNMMRESFEDSLISGELKHQVINLHIDYPLGEAKIRGSFVLRHIANTPAEKISDLAFEFIQKLEIKSLKRQRESSAETKSQVIDMPKIKPIAKKKKPKQIGSKII